jgi:hypothetical protein
MTGALKREQRSPRAREGVGRPLRRHACTYTCRISLLTNSMHIREEQNGSCHASQVPEVLGAGALAAKAGGMAGILAAGKRPLMRRRQPCTG